jgi:hypothetical protein
MRISDVLSDVLDGLGNARLALRSPSVLMPFLAFGALQVVLLSFLAFVDWPPTSDAALSLSRQLGGDAALHYPMHFVLLPRLWETIYLPLVALVGFPLWTWAVWMMVNHHEIGRRVAARPFGRMLPAVLVVGIVFVAVSAGLGRAGGAVAPLAGRFAGLATIAAILLVALAQTFLIYTPAVLRIRGGGLVSGVRASVRYAARHFWPTLLVILTVLAVHAPVDLLIASSHRVALRFHPETVYFLMLGSIALEVITAYVLFAAVVGLALPEEGGLR